MDALDDLAFCEVEFSRFEENRRRNLFTEMVRAIPPQAPQLHHKTSVLHAERKSWFACKIATKGCDKSELLCD